MSSPALASIVEVGDAVYSQPLGTSVKSGVRNGDIEDCDFHWRSGKPNTEGEDCELRKFLNPVAIETRFKTVTALDVLMSPQGRLLTVIGVESSSRSHASEIMVLDTLSQSSVASFELDCDNSEKAQVITALNHGRSCYFVVGTVFRVGDKELGRVRLLGLDESTQRLTCTWSNSSTPDHKIYHLHISAIKVLPVAPYYPQDEGIVVQRNFEQEGYLPRDSTQRPQAEVLGSPWIVIGFKNKTFSIFTLSDNSSTLSLLYSFSGKAKEVAHTDLLLTITAFQSGSDITVVTGSWDKTVRFWTFKWARDVGESGSWQLVPRLKQVRGNGDGVGGGVQIFRVHKKSVTAMVSHTFSVPERVQRAGDPARWFHISKVLVTGSLDTSVIVWDLESGEVIRKLQGHTDQINCVKVFDSHMDGLPPLVITSGKDLRLILWNLVSGEIVREIALAKDMPMFSVAQTKRGALLIIGSSGNEVHVYNFDAVERIRRLETDAVTAIDVFYPRIGEQKQSLRDPLVVVGAIDGTVSVFNYFTGKEQAALKIPRCQDTENVELGNDGNGEEDDSVIDDPTVARTLFASSRNMHKPATSGDRRPELKPARQHDPNGHTDRINSTVLYTPTDPTEEALVITTSSDNWVKVWQLDGGQFLCNLGRHAVTAYPLTIYNPSIFAQDSYCQEQWKAAGISETRLDKPLVISGDRGGEIKIWDLESGLESYSSGKRTDCSSVSLVSAFKAHSAMVRALLVHYPREDVSNPLLISGAYDKTAVLWNLRTREKLYVLQGAHSGFIFALAVYNPFEHVGAKDAVNQSSILVTGSYDSTAITWNLNEFTTTSSSDASQGRRNLLKGHSESVTDLSIFCPRNAKDRPLLVTCSIDKLVIVWDLFSGERQQTLVGHTDRVCFMTIFNPPPHILQQQLTNVNSAETKVSSSRSLLFPTIISGGDDKVNIIWEDTLYQTKLMPTREMVNRAFACDLSEGDWPLLTRWAQDWNGSIFYENSHLFYLAIRHKRPDFLLKFQRYLARVLPFMREYDAQCFNGSPSSSAHHHSNVDDDDNDNEAMGDDIDSLLDDAEIEISRKKSANFFASLYSQLCIELPRYLGSLPQRGFRRLEHWMSPVKRCRDPVDNRTRSTVNKKPASVQFNVDDASTWPSPPQLRRAKSSLELLESRRRKNLLMYAIEQNDLVSLRVVLLSWAKILNTDMTNMLLQRLYHPMYFFPEVDLEVLAQVYPLEYMHFLTSLRLIRTVPSLLHQERARLDEMARLELHGSTSRCVSSRHIWGRTIGYANSIAQHQGSAAQSWVLQIFEEHFSGTSASKAQPITALLVPMKLPVDLRDLLQQLVYVSEQLDRVELFDSDLGRLTLRYLWHAHGRHTHTTFAKVYFLFLCVFNVQIFVYEVYAEETQQWMGCVLSYLGLIGSVVYLLYAALFRSSSSQTYSNTRNNSINARSGNDSSSAWTGSLYVSMLVVLFNLCLYHFWLDELMAWMGVIGMNLLHAAVGVGFFFYAVEELAQAFEKYKNLSLHTLFLHFCCDVWNMLDLGIIVSGGSGQVLRLCYQQDTTVGRCCLACASVLMWFKLLYYLRPFSRSGPLVVMIITIAHEIRILLMVLFFVLCGFTQAFWLISNQEADLNHFGTLEKAFYNGFLYMVGQNIDPNFEHTVSQRFGKLLLIMFLLVMAVMLLNLLVALMGDVFSRVRAEGMARWRKEQASIVLENKFSLEDYLPSGEVLDRWPAWMRDWWNEQLLRPPSSSTSSSGWMDTLRQWMTKSDDPPYLHVLKYSAEVRTHVRRGHRQLQGLLRLSRSQVRPFTVFRLSSDSDGGDNSDEEDDLEDDVDDVHVHD